MTLLAKLYERDKVDLDKFESASIKIALANCYHVGISPGVLLRAARDSGWLPKETFVQVLKTLSRPEVNVQSMVAVLANFLYELYKQPLAVDRSYLVQQILSEATRHHDGHSVIHLLDATVSSRFRLLPVQAADVKGIISTWQQLHGL